MDKDAKFRCVVLSYDEEQGGQTECGEIGDYVEMKRHLRLDHGQGVSDHFGEFTEVVGDRELHTDTDH